MENQNYANPYPNSQPKKERKPLGFGLTMLASAVGVLIAGIILSAISFVISIIMTVVLLSSIGNDQSITVKDGSYVHIDLRKPVQEAAPSALENLFSNNETNGADVILKSIRDAKEDSRIKGLYVTVGGTSGLNWGLTEELRNAIKDFAEKKDVVFYGETYSQPEYYLATASQHIFLHPDGMIDFRGIGSQVMYYKDLFDKLGVKVDLIRPASCAYKSAGETYTMNHMSEANREQIHVYINSIWKHVSSQIAEARRLPLDTINYYADNLIASLGKDAYKNAMVDSLLFEHDVLQYTKNSLERKHTISAEKYAQAAPAEKHGGKKVAVIYAYGNVQAGENTGFGSGIYTKPLVKALDEAAVDDNVCAIVLRVNSPGGAATTSQSITDAVRRAKTHKPVVVSMSDYAASAGYEMSCLADCIVAQPTTITGSIGVFGTIPEIGGMLKNKLGITFDTASTNKNSTGLSLTAPLSPAARNMMQRNVEDFYVTFVSTVADGRKLKYEYVDSIAKGRVWTGTDAQKLGLVDKIGGIYDAIETAASLAGVENYYAVRFPAKKDLMSQLMQLSGNSNKEYDEYNFSLRQRISAILWAKQAMKNKSHHFATFEEQFMSDMESLTAEPTLQARIPYYIIAQ